MLALAALQDERIRAQLSRAPAAVRAWAASRDSTGRANSLLGRYDPTQRFGQKGIERRLSALRINAAMVFPNFDDPTGEAIHHAVDELSRATVISETMPLNERRRARSRITGELTRLEQALVDAVLPLSTG